MSKLRSKYFVDKSVQGALARRVVTHWCIFFLLASLSLFTMEYFLGGAEVSLSGHIAAVWNKYAFFFILMLVIMPTFIYDTVKLTNRFAGPIHRLKESLKNLADGRPVNDLKFREDDFWCELSEDFNRVIKRVNPSTTTKG